jgi:hypothetical protein
VTILPQIADLRRTSSGALLDINIIRNTFIIAGSIINTEYRYHARHTAHLTTSKQLLPPPLPLQPLPSKS